MAATGAVVTTTPTTAPTTPTTPVATIDSVRRRESFGLFVREQVDGSAESWMRVFEDWMADANAIGKEAYPGRVSITPVMFDGTLSDHNTGERKVNRLLNEAKKAIDSTMNVTAQMFCWNHK